MAGIAGVLPANDIIQSVPRSELFALCQVLLRVVIDENIVAVTGGHLSKRTRYNSVLVNTMMVSGVRFFSIDKRDTRLVRMELMG